MNRDEARQEIKMQWRALIATMTVPAQKKVNGETSWVCPLCGHGAHGDGLTLNRQNPAGTGLKCFGCGFSGDILDLYQQANSTDYSTALTELAGQIGITIDRYKPDAAADFAPESRRTRQDAPKTGQRGNVRVEGQKLAERPDSAPEPDYTGYYAACRARIKEPAAVDYLKLRGISLQTAMRCGVGYDAKADPANNPGGTGSSIYPASRLIIPLSKKSYVARATNQNQKEYKKLFPKGGGGELFNVKCLYTEDVQEVFVTEGALDAISVIECGRQAVALNSANNAEKLVKQLEARPTAATLILCLDNDAAGKRATETISAGLLRLNVSFIAADISGKNKDPNEHLTANRPEFERAIAEAVKAAGSRPDNTAAYIETLMEIDIERFKSDKKTGFAELDRKAGGLYSGFYVLAAISSLGKTTFLHQIAEQLAAHGTDVLFFSLEQSRLELVSKSLVRRIAADDPFTRANSLAIRRGDYKEQRAEAAKKYIADVGERLSIIEGNFVCDISFIGNYVRKYVSRNNVRPVVMVDYLQILQPPAGTDRRQGMKESVDMIVTELKRLSRELDLTIIAVSSVNRANYLTPIDFESLKESGAIEFTADVVWGMQLQILNDELFNTEKKIKEKRDRVKQAKAETPRKIELVCLKNRYGISSYNVNFSYYPAIDTFREESAPDEEFNSIRDDEATPFDFRRKSNRV